jgi:hypothetical protein
MGLGDLMSRLVTYLAMIVLSFFLGGVVTLHDLPPSDSIRQTALLTTALLSLANYEHDGRWRQAHHPPSPLGPTTPHRRDQTQDGLNFFVSGNTPEAFLMTMDGEIIHRWLVPFDHVWGDPPHVTGGGTKAVYWPRAYLYPNGDILAIYHGYGDTPYGYGLAKIDKDSRVIWKAAANIHHDVDVGADGTIYTLYQEIQHADEPGVANLKAPFIAEGILVLNSGGDLLKRISIIDALKKSPYAPLLYSMKPDARGDVTHINAVQLIERTPAPGHPFKEGSLLVSLRNTDTIAVVDLESETVTWAMTGMWRRQHYPKLLDNGNILIFDNQGHFGEGGASRVLEFDPVTQGVEWSYVGDRENVFESDRWGSQQRLTNGNTLITESTNGRAFEVTPEGDVVWEYRSPVRSGDNDEYVLVLPDMQRVDPDTLTFIDRNRLNVALAKPRHAPGSGALR